MNFAEVVGKEQSGFTRFRYNTSIRNIVDLFTDLTREITQYHFSRRDNEIEVYSQGQFIGRILDNGTSFLVGEGLMKEPIIAYTIRRS